MMVHLLLWCLIWRHVYAHEIWIEGVLTGVKIPPNKGRHCPFRKSQLDLRTFGVASSMGLWTRYHSKVFGYSLL